MTSQRAAADQHIDGPFTRHLYLGFCARDLDLMVKLQECLERRSISCFPRCDPSQKLVYLKSMIDEGIACSVKCLVYLSDDYIDDELFRMESIKIISKGRRFSRDVVIVLRDANLTKTCHDFDGFDYEIFKPAHLQDDSYLNSLAVKVLKEPNPALALMPKENIGYGSALGYFYGFLRLVLPDFRQRLEQNILANDPQLRSKTVKKMLIIMPESCFCPPEFTESGKIEHTDKYVVRMAHRAGNKNRDYKSSLYKIYDSQNKAEYYFVGELATPLLTMYESYYFGLAGLSRDQLYTERDAFYVSLKAILSHRDNRECNGQFKLLFWPSDPETKKTQTVSLYDFLLPAVREELHLQQDTTARLEADSADTIPVGKSTATADNDRVRATSSEDKQTFTSVVARGSNPSAVYEETLFDRYVINRDAVRGICLLINISNFAKGNPPLSPRHGAAVDSETLTKLFGDTLHFEVKQHNDVEMETLEKLLLTMSLVDHSNYDVFACCILTHGKLGVLYTSDVRPVRIVDIAEYFNDEHCPTLRGKPKLFFIQACQTGSEGDDSQPQNTQSPGTYGQEPTDGEDASVAICVPSPSGYISEPDASPLDCDANKGLTMIAANEQPTTWLEKKAALIPGSPDFIMSYSTLPGSSAFRDPETGSLYVNELAKCLSQGLEMDRALKLVSKGVKEQLQQRSQQDRITRFQLPFHLTSGMDKFLYLLQ